MTRTGRRRALWVVALVGWWLPPAVAADNGEQRAALDLGSRRELFVDTFLIDQLAGAELRLHEPVPAEIAIRIDRPWEGEFNYGARVLEDGGTYRLYYRGWPVGGPAVRCCAESRDGIAWTKPNLGLTEVAGTRDNNVIATEDGKPAYVDVFIDTRPGVEPNERYKGLTSSGYQGAQAMYLWVSDDGLRWRKVRDEPVFSSKLPNAFDGQSCAFWSVAENRYVCYVRYMVKGVRATFRITSPDLLTWSEPAVMTYGETGPQPPENLYTNQTDFYFRAPHLYVAFPARFMPGRRVLTEEQVAGLAIAKLNQGGRTHVYHKDCADGAFMTSRGGTRYDRTFMEVFVRPGPGPENWTSRTNYPLRGVVRTGPAEMSIYVNRHYPQKSWHIQRCTLRLDGFASVRAPYAGGEMVTKPFTFAGKELELNFSTSAPGSIRVEIQDDRGRPLPGYGLADCPEIIGDRIAGTVVWKGGGDVSKLAGKPIRLRFVMKDADLYAIAFRP